MGEPWVFRLDFLPVLTSQGLLQNDLVVCDILLDDLSGCNELLVNQLFEHTSTSKIVAMPFAPFRNDELMWRFEKTDVYSTKSGYAVWM